MASSCWRVETAGNGKPALVRPDGRWAESRYKPDLDAERRVEAEEVAESESVLLFGMGAGELPRAILRRIGPRGTLAIVEPIGAAACAALDGANADDLISDDRVSLLAFGTPPENCAARYSRVRFMDEPTGFMSALGALIRDGECDRFVVHPSVEWPPELSEFARLMKDLDLRKLSALHEKDLLDENVKRNRARFLEAPGVEELRGILSGGDAVIAGGGPSLERLAAAVGPHARWISVTRSLETLRLLGIAPLIAIATDPRREIADHIAPLPRATPLVIFPTTNADAATRTERLIAAFAEGDGGRAMKPLRDEIGELPAAGSVSTSALGLAVMMGAKRVFLAGVDLAEPAGRSHARGTVMELDRLGAVGRFGGMEQTRMRDERTMVERGERIFGESVTGELLPTKPNLILYARAMARLAARYRETKIIQLSSTALKIDGIELGDAADVERERTRITLPCGVRSRIHGGLL